MHKILFLPAHTKGQGTGHIKRCASLAALLEAAGCRVYFLQQSGADYTALDSIIRNPGWIITSPTQCPDPHLVILDNRETDLKALANLPWQAPVAGIDEGGKAREYLPLLIDTLPVPARLQQPNVCSLVQNPHPGTLACFRYPFKKVLLTFGGEDKAGLTGKLLAGLLKHKLFTPREITVIEGPCFTLKSWTPGIGIIQAPPDLALLLHDYDLVFTHFGITCFEAVSAGIPVILFNPSRYHRQLSRQCRLPEIGVGKPAVQKLTRWLKDQSFWLHKQAALKKKFSGKAQDTVQLIRQFALRGNLHCPVCFTGWNRAVARFPGRTYFSCKKCGVIYLAGFSADNKQVYDEAYFFAQYKAQYGKTYLEDFANIKSMSLARVKAIAHCTGTVQGKTLLDIGCAYGPFLQAFAEAGGIPHGMDLAAPAVRYVQEELKFPAYCADFEKSSSVREILEHFGIAGGFDAVTMWYVVEHFVHLHTVLCAVNRLVKPGGIFAIATPNGTGISARKNRKEFLRQSPPDHYTILSPGTLERLLPRYGFRVKRVRITGHHPERFPGMALACRQGFLWKLAAGVSRLAGLGDTCEVYAGKVRELEN